MTDFGTQLHISRSGGHLALQGEIDAHTAPRLEAELCACRLDGEPTVRLDMTGVTFMDSSGLRVIITASDEARRLGGDVVVVAPTTSVTRLIEISGLDRYLTVENPAS